MKYTIIFGIWLVVLLFVFKICCSSNTNSKRLQIGIKKRAKNCTVKSKKGDLLHVYYQGSFESEEIFDSNLGGNLFTFTLGSEEVIKGWDQGLLGMCAGEHRKLLIPPHLGYGDVGVPSQIKPFQLLIFEIELIKIERKL